jgi:hypothetical protein
VAQRHGYRNRLNFNSYTVFIARADRTKDSAGHTHPISLCLPANMLVALMIRVDTSTPPAMVLAFNPAPSSSPNMSMTSRASQT